MVKSSYLNERNYTTEKKEKKRTERYLCWEELLGKDKLKKIIKYNENVENFLMNQQFEVNQNRSVRFPTYAIEKIEEFKNDKNIFFYEFYRSILADTIFSFRDYLKEKSNIVCEEVVNDFALCLFERIQKICMRTLIFKMNMYKYSGILQGANEEEEYNYFCKEIVGTKAFIDEVFAEFPVLERCVQEKVNYTMSFYKEVIENFEESKNDIFRLLTEENAGCLIKKISYGLGDTHNNGRQVVKISLLNGSEIIYKPHPMNNEVLYHKVLSEISNELRVKQYTYPIISRKKYSWCKVVKTKSCESEKELSFYYKRMGIQLFLAYLLGIRDIHSENLIAVGEFPVIIDLEMIINMDDNTTPYTSEEAVRKKVLNSVLMTGILPFYVWNQNGDGINISAFSGQAGSRYPFKVPTIINGRTSKMRLAYKIPISNANDNLAKLNGKFINPVYYEKEIVRGFSKAYEWAIRNKEIIGYTRRKMSVRNRVLMADTQKYAMLLSASYHPSLLKDGADRELFLHSLWEGRKEEQKSIVESEIRALLKGDIPYFYVNTDDIDVRDEDGVVGNGYYSTSPRNIVVNRLNSLSEKDMNRQVEYIRLSLEMSETDRYTNNLHKTNEIYVKKGKRVDKPYKQLLSMIVENAIWNKDFSEVSWEVVNFNKNVNSTWDIRPMNVYLYNGLAGMLILFYGLQKYEKDKTIKNIFDTLKNNLFQYTDSCTDNIDNLYTRYTGMYEGEASIVYTYVVLYKWSHESCYLVQAEKHAEILVKLLEEDKKYDLVYGNAGAAKALLQLYYLTGNEKYLYHAEHAVDIMLSHKNEIENGIGWFSINATDFMTGMAHGNSGILDSIVSLWKETGKEKYKYIIDKMQMFENMLYANENLNVKELSIAWCHGAAGMLLAKTQYYNSCKNILPEQEKMKNDIINEYVKLSNNWKRDSYTLCHGNCGNIWIMEYIKKQMNISDEEIYEHAKETMGEIYLLPPETINPGMMNGYGGILYYLLSQRYDDIPFILI